MAISIKNRGILLDDHGPEDVQPSLWKPFLRGLVRPVKSQELLFFTSQLSLMLEIETPLNLSLRAIRDQTENGYFKEAITAILRDIEEGSQLSNAMKRHPEIFSDIYTSMVASGESGGFLKDILDRIVEILEKRRALVTQLRSTLTYPLVLCVVSIFVIFFIMVSVLPKFSAFFMSRMDILPMTTKLLMKTSSILLSYWWIVIISGIGLATCLVLFKNSKRGRGMLDWLSINFPIVADLSNKIYISQFLRILGHLMESHVPLLEALEVTLGTVKNRYFRQLIHRVMAHVREGGKFARPFAEYSYVPETVKQMIRTGEEAGNLSKVMLRLAEHYDKEVEKGLKILSSMIEPIALIVMGTVIGLIVSSVILPLFRLAHVMH